MIKYKHVHFVYNLFTLLFFMYNHGEWSYCYAWMMLLCYLPWRWDIRQLFLIKYIWIWLLINNVTTCFRAGSVIWHRRVRRSCSADDRAGVTDPGLGLRSIGTIVRRGPSSGGLVSTRPNAREGRLWVAKVRLLATIH